MLTLSGGEVTLVIPAINTSSHSASWQIENQALVSFQAPANLTYQVPQGEYSLTIVGNNAGNLPTSPGYSFKLNVTANGVTSQVLLTPPYIVTIPVKVLIGQDGQLNIAWINDEYVANKYDSNLRVVEIRLDPTKYDPTFAIIKKLTAATWTPLTDKEATWLLGV